MTGQDDSDLAVRIRRRDPQAIGHLYDRYGKLAYSLAYRMIGDAPLAEDIVAEAFIKCWNRIASLKETRGGSLGLWLLGVTRNHTLEYLRARGGTLMGARSTDVFLEEPQVIQDWHRARNPEHIKRLQAAFLAIDADEKKVLELAYLEGLTPAAIATRMERLPADTRSLIDSALRKLSPSENE